MLIPLNHHQLTTSHIKQITQQPTQTTPKSTTMPRNGTQSDNPVDTSAGNQVHGVGEDSSIDRSQKVRQWSYTQDILRQCTNTILPGRPRSLSREGRGHRGHERLRRWKQDHWYVTQPSYPNHPTKNFH
jgi:hypothetical protein